MDASTATATASNLFGNMEQKFDLATLLRNVAAAAAASTAVTSANTITAVGSSTATSPNSVESSSSTNGPAVISSSPSPPHHTHGNSAELKPIPASSLAPPGVVQRRQLPFSPIQPIYAPSGHGRQILIYDSRSHPGRRREFAYKTRFTNQSGLTTVYYRCMACRALRHRLQRSLPKEKLPAVPCIAVKNDLLINDPDFPEASDHFCTPLTIDESNQRLRNTFERGHKRARMKMANSTVEETIRKVGKIRAEEGECLGDDGDTELGMDMWTKAGDGSSSSAGFMDLNGTLDGSDCSSDSIVDVLKEESPDEDMMMAEHGYSPAPYKTSGSEDAGDEPAKDEEKHGDSKEDEQQQTIKHDANISTPPVAANTSPTNGRPLIGCSANRSPRKKLDSLLKMAEIREAAKANGNNGGGHGSSNSHSKEEQKPIGGKQNGQQHLANEQLRSADTHPMPAPLPIQLNSLLSSAAGHFQQPQQSGGTIPASVQSIHAIAARLSRGGTSAASELSKALAGIKGQHHQQQQQKSAFTNGIDKSAAAVIGCAHQQFPLLNGGGPIPPAMGVHIAELLKKYVENNLELAPETAGSARSTGELACALFMAQMVENAELRQEVQKLRGELDSLKALVAAAAVVQHNNNNGIGNGHHRLPHQHRP